MATERRLHALVAEFDDVASITSAARRARESGYTRFEVYSPFPIHGIERAMGLRATRLPWLVLGAGLTGLACAFLLQWWTNAVDYPFRISGKPLFGVPANVPIAFEVTVLFAAFTAFFGMLILNRLPQHHHPIFESERFRRATDDGFFLAIEADDPRFEPRLTRGFLDGLAPRSIEECREAAPSHGVPAWIKAAIAATVAALLVPPAWIVAARFQDSARPPFHLVHDMDAQARHVGQSANPHFEDGRAMRPDVEGTVAFGEWRDDARLATGKDGESWCASIPLDVDAQLLARGRERYGIFCAPCHGLSGYGDGLVAQRASDLQEPTWVPPSSLHDPVVRGRSVGQLYDVVRNGARTMPAYAAQIPVQDSWAIVAYVRALQRSQHATLADVPEAERAALGAH
ncbi:MAG: DUF3341 domain-containing protein [Planctomycetes bacterium]|nr:DUF3341 domain-containing protein [Planctomycetota bacterium]